MPRTKTTTIKKEAPKKRATKKVAFKEAPKKEKKERYIESVGRRKTSVARVRIFPGGGKEILVNEKPLASYFPTIELQGTILSPLKLLDLLDQFRVSIRVKGGGVNSQAGAVRHGIAKALVSFNAELRSGLKKAGFLTRDPRMRERKKFGLKRARRAPQWRKR